MSAIVPEPSDIVKLPLSLSTVHTVFADGKPWVVLRPAVEDLGLTFSPQLQKLQQRSWATMLNFDTVAEDGKIRHMVCVDVRTFLMWAATIPTHRVHEGKRGVLEEYQNETADVVESYWTRGGAINPRADAGQLAALTQRVAELEKIYPTWEAIMSEEGDFSVRDTAAILSRDHDIVIGQNALFALMRQWGILDRNNRIYATHKERLVRRMYAPYTDKHGEERRGGTQVRVKPEGVAYLHRRMVREQRV